jgi:hypothetical protein
VPEKPQRSKSKERPLTKLKVDQLLGERSKHELATAMGLKFYNQIYQYLGGEANPTLLMLEKLARGLTKVCGKRVSIAQILDEPRNL